MFMYLLCLRMRSIYKFFTFFSLCILRRCLISFVYPPFFHSIPFYYYLVAFFHINLLAECSSVAFSKLFMIRYNTFQRIQVKNESSKVDFLVKAFEEFFMKSLFVFQNYKKISGIILS